MVGDVDIQAGLDLLFRKGLELALKVQEDAMEAETAEDRARLSTAFHRLSRSVRQTAALKARLERDAGRCEREAVQAEVEGQARRIKQRQGYLKAVVERLVWSEHEHDETERDILIDHLDILLTEDALEDGFAEASIEAQIERLCDDLGLANPGWAPNTPAVILRSGDTPDPGDDDRDYWNSA